MQHSRARQKNLINL